MIKPKCPNCSQPPKIGFWERRMMGTYSGKACNNCEAILEPPKWEDWLMAPMIFFGVIGGNYFGEALAIMENDVGNVNILSNLHIRNLSISPLENTAKR